MSIDVGGNNINIQGQGSTEINANYGLQIRPGINGTLTPSVAGQVLTANGTSGEAIWSDAPGGGSSEPLSQIVFGTGAGTTSSPNFIYDANGQFQFTSGLGGDIFQIIDSDQGITTSFSSDFVGGDIL